MKRTKRIRAIGVDVRFWEDIQSGCVDVTMFYLTRDDEYSNRTYRNITKPSFLRAQRAQAKLATDRGLI